MTPPADRRFAVELVPGRRVELVTPADEDALLARAAERVARGEPDEGAPYWAVLWRSAAPLARFVLARDLARERRVLELGCGLGLTGIALALFAGAEVTLTDAQEGSVEHARASVALNGSYRVAPVVERLDWSRPGDVRLGERFPLVLAADCLYDRAAFGPLARCAAAWLAPGGVVVLAEPGRAVARDAEVAFAEAGLVVAERVEYEGVSITVLGAGQPA